MNPAEAVADLTTYVTREPAYRGFYGSYQPKTELIDEIRQRLPEAHVIVVSEMWCGDCRRNVPRWARLAEQLPGWQHTLLTRSDEAAQRLRIRAIPSFVLLDPTTGVELGRITENPVLGSLEADVLNIVRAARPDNEQP